MSPETTLVGHHSSGHDACPPVPVVEGAPTVRAAGCLVARVGDKLSAHECPIHQPHQGVIAQGAPHVRIAGCKVARKGDLVDCGPAQDTLAEGLASVRIGNCGGEEYGRELAFEMLTSPMDKLILCLEEISINQYELEDERDRQGWAYLQDFLPKWMNKKAYVITDKYDNGGQEPYFIDWNWMMSYVRFYYNYLELINSKYLFSDLAQKKLASILEYDGNFNVSESNFDHINIPWNQLRIHAFQNRSAILRGPELILGSSGTSFPFTPDGLMVAVGNVTVFAVASGTTQVLPTGTKRIRINEVAFFVHDGFEFSGDQTLGWWDCKSKTISVFSGKEVQNKDFRHFREHTGYGCDFRIMTKPTLVWTGMYEYDIK